ncbi:hypothetical protein XH89_25885 [Bradyrhizobium sp. CCBAU 53340]|uniref:hypothetical protein n=1 Tax=Bradyrhizobium sp. CCBAU 53340 TaxID=1325112 RepID=UPI00188B1904|nr:hypothetical protein [Bradyrhizobium sp. CCBAU 53340]QOZ46516.1 hypothetical protein XH89_25885 [Bradyrhizobium sp. CCBAU 53340]
MKAENHGGRTVDNGKLDKRLSYLEGQVSRLLTALCCALSVILVFIFYDRRPFFLDQDYGTLFIRMAGVVASAFLVGWPIVRWIVGKKSEQP